jgi:hypothetical protein
MRSTLLTVLLAALAVLVAPGAPGAHAADTTGEVRWSVVPAPAADDSARVSLRHVADPGQRVEDEIVVTNSSATPATFVVAAGDGVLGANGAFDIRSGTPEDSGAWITVGGLDDGELRLAAGASRTLPVSVDVPEAATPGDHPAGIVVGITQSDDGVAVSHRIGVRWHLQVAGEIAPGLEVSEVTTAYDGTWVPFGRGDLTVSWTVTNVGNVRLGSGAVARAEGPFGLGGAEASAEGPVELLPGMSAEQSVTLSPRALFRLGGELEVAPVSIGDDAVALPAPTTVELSQSAVSWTGLALVLLVVAGAVAAALRVVRRRRGPGDTDGPEAPEDPAEEAPVETAASAVGPRG